MSDTDEMIESAGLDDLRAELSTVVVPPAPSLDRIRARGRARRRHRRTTIAAVAGVAGVATAGAGLALAGTGGAASAPDSALRTIRTTAYTLVSNSDGTATLTISPEELFDPATLQDDLAHDGIPAKVTVGTFCTSDPTPSGFAQAVSFDPGSAGTATSPRQPATITIDPAAMPSGTKLSIGEIGLRHDIQFSGLALIDANSFTCTDTVPTDGPDGTNDGLHHGMAFIMIPGPSDSP